MIEPPFATLFSLPTRNICGDFGPIFGAVLPHELFDELVLLLCPWPLLSLWLRPIGEGRKFRKIADAGVLENPKRNHNADYPLIIIGLK